MLKILICKENTYNINKSNSISSDLTNEVSKITIYDNITIENIKRTFYLLLGFMSHGNSYIL